MLRSKKQPLGSCGVKFLGSPDALVGEFVHQHVVGMLDGSGLVAVPSDQIKTAAAFGVGAVGEDAEVANPVAARNSSPWRGRMRIAR